MRRALYVMLVLLPAATIISAKNYKGAELRTKEAYVYGRFEAGIKPPAGSGMLASFFTYHEFTDTTWWNEIDFEILGRYDHDVQVTTIVAGQKTRNSHQRVPFNTHLDFHVYAFEWTPDYVAWFIDGREYYRQTEAHVATLRFPQKIMMNIWNPEWTPWSGAWNDKILPLFAEYDWVSYSSYTPGTGSTGTNNNFTLQWKDDFDAWDQNRWEKATHTWGGNGCDFVTENVVFQDGRMILCLTNATQLGYTDKTAPAVLWARQEGERVRVHFSERVEQAGAENKANFVISGLTVNSAQLAADQRTVWLSVDGWDPVKNYNLIVIGVKDRMTPANRVTGQVMPIIATEPLTFPLSVNAGGPAAMGFLPDQLWSPAAEYGHQDGYVDKYPASLDILNTELDSVYQTGLKEVVEYLFRVPAGRYRVTLLFAENTHQAANSRRFDVWVQDEKVIDNMDLYDLVGKNTAWQTTSPWVEVRDGLLEIHFTNLKDFSLINGIVLEADCTGVEKVESAPVAFELQQNYPNPFNTVTTLSYYLPQAADVQLTVYDVRGCAAAQLQHGLQPAGWHRLHWQAPAATGIYFYTLTAKAGDLLFTDTKKMVLIK